MPAEIGGTLRPRELETVSLIADGKQNKEIAKIMGLTVTTVKEYNYRIFQKLGFSNRTQVATWFVRGVGLLCLLIISVFAQALLGAVTSAATTAVSATAGTAMCDFLPNPALTQVVSNCYAPGAVHVDAFSIPLSGTGTVGSFTAAGNTITWS